MNPIVRWFHQLGSPPTFDRFAARWAPWCWAIAAVLLAVGIYQALWVVPAERYQGDSFRILYIHVPAAWLGMGGWSGIAVSSVAYLVWRHPLAHIAARAIAPAGALFAALCLITGSIWAGRLGAPGGNGMGG